MIKIHNFRRDLTDISSKTAKLCVTFRDTSHDSASGSTYLIRLFGYHSDKWTSAIDVATNSNTGWPMHRNKQLGLHPLHWSHALPVPSSSASKPLINRKLTIHRQHYSGWVQLLVVSLIQFEKAQKPVIHFSKLYDIFSGSYNIALHNQKKRLRCSSVWLGRLWPCSYCDTNNPLS